MDSTKYQLSQRAGPEAPDIISIQTILKRSVERAPDTLAVVVPHESPDFLSIQEEESDVRQEKGLRWTRSQLHHRARKLAGALAARGINERDSIASTLYNGAAVALGVWMSLMTGCPWVPLNPKSIGSPLEMQHTLRMASSKVLIVEDDSMAGEIEKCAPEELKKVLVKIIAKGDKAPPSGWIYLQHLLFEESSTRSKGFVMQEDSSNLALIIFTSGTTSLPKACPWTYSQLGICSQTRVLNLKLSSGHRTCNFIPPHGIYWFSITLPFWQSDGVVVFPSAIFNPKATLEAIERERCTHFGSVPSMVNALLEQTELEAFDTKCLEQVDISGASVSPSIVRACLEKLNIGRVANAFGMSEGTPILETQYTLDAAKPAGRLASTFQIYSGVCIKICATNERTPVECGKIGELHMSGPCCIDGYIGTTSDAFYNDGEGSWVITGDQATMEVDGNLRLTGRYKDIIIRGGRNISPAPIEDLIEEHAGVTCQVVAATDDFAGEVPVAILERAPRHHSVKDLYAKIRSDLGASYVPDNVYTLEELSLQDWPKTAGGKIRKTELRKAVKAFRKQAEESKSASEPTTEGSIIRLWSDLTRVSEGDLSAATNIFDLADSITVTRFRDRVKRELGVAISSQEMVNTGGEIGQQVSLVQSRVKKSGEKSSQSARPGPPKIDNVPSACGDKHILEHIQSKANLLLDNFSLSWDKDVEDVLPVSDMGRFVNGTESSQICTLQFYFVTTKSDTKDLLKALEATLIRFPTFRSLLLDADNVMDSAHLIIRPTKSWFEHTVRIVAETESPETMRSLGIHDEWLLKDSGAPLFRAIILPIKSSRTAGLIFAANHSVFDGVSNARFLEDLECVLEAQGQLPPYTDYALFAETHYLHRKSVGAQNLADFHMKRLKGISKLRSCFWPARDSAESPPEERRRKIIVRKTKFDNLQKAKSELETEIHILAKAALILANTLLTGQSHAIFAQFEASRDWPFLGPRVSDQLPSLMEAHGPTFTSVLNNFQVEQNESVRSFIQRVDTDQRSIATRVQAPIFSVSDALGNEDGEAMLDAMRLQTFNWLPQSQPTYRNFERLGQQGFGNAGLIWNTSMPDQNTVVVAAAHDPQQKTVDVENGLNLWMDTLEWLCESKHLDMQVDELKLDEK